MIKIDELNVLELFGGIGAIRKALIRQKISHKTVDYVEIDKNCVKSYNALYGEEFEPKSIVDYHPPDEKIDLLKVAQKVAVQEVVFFLKQYE